MLLHKILVHFKVQHMNEDCINSCCRCFCYYADFNETFKVPCTLQWRGCSANHSDNWLHVFGFIHKHWCFINTFRWGKNASQNLAKKVIDILMFVSKAQNPHYHSLCDPIAYSLWNANWCISVKFTPVENV